MVFPQMKQVLIIEFNGQVNKLQFMSDLEINRLRKQMQQMNKQLEEVLSQNEMYKNYIESLLEYNNKLVNIIEKELKIGIKVESNLQPISERTENDSQMVSDNRSVSIRGMRVLGGSQHGGNERQRQPSSPTKRQTKHKTEDQRKQQIIYQQIYQLMQKYQNNYIAKREYYQNQFRTIIQCIQQDRSKFMQMQDQNMDTLENRQNELRNILEDLRSIETTKLINKISEKNKKLASEIYSSLDQIQKKK